jgi:hypothetical protein
LGSIEGLGVGEDGGEVVAHAALAEGGGLGLQGEEEGFLVGSEGGDELGALACGAGGRADVRKGGEMTAEGAEFGS